MQLPSGSDPTSTCEMGRQGTHAFSHERLNPTKPVRRPQQTDEPDSPPINIQTIFLQSLSERPSKQRRKQRQSRRSSWRQKHRHRLGQGSRGERAEAYMQTPIRGFLACSWASRSRSLRRWVIRLIQWFQWVIHDTLILAICFTAVGE
jgi:hypothetical protein